MTRNFVDPLDVIALAKKGLTIKEAADEIGCQRATVEGIARDVGIEFVNGNDYRKADPKKVAKAVRARKGGATWRDVAQRSGLSLTGARKAVLRECGEDPWNPPPEPGLPEVRAYLVDLRLNSPLSQTQVAKDLGVTQGWLSGFERGVRSGEPKMSTIASYAATLGYSVSVVVENEETGEQRTFRVPAPGQEWV